MTNFPTGHLACSHLAADEFWFLRWIVRLRWFFFLSIAGVLLAGYNGQWRVRSDSALYRGLARSLVAGKGYTFRGEHDNQAYPGLPILLAGVERICGRQDGLRPTATLWTMLVLAGLTLVCIYHLILEHFPRWVAVCVTTGVGINPQFLQQAHEIMTDLPFLLGVCLTLLAIARLRGRERFSGKSLPNTIRHPEPTREGSGRDVQSQMLREYARHDECCVTNDSQPALIPDRPLVRRATVNPSRILWAGLLLLGAALTCSTRPTMWILVAAGIGAAFLQILRTRRWKTPLLAIAILLAFVAIWAAIDLRGGPLSGKHERSVVRHIQNLFEEQSPARLSIAQRFARLTSAHVPEALFGFHMPVWIGIPLTALLFGLAAWRARFLPVWGLYTVLSLAMLLVMGSNPRYLLMVLPMLLVEWALLCHFLARWLIPLIPWRFTPDWAMLSTLTFATIIQLALSANLILEQHGRSYHNHFKPTEFLVSYRNGNILALKQLADAIRVHVPPGKVILAPEGRITSFLSGRVVFDTKDIFANKPATQWAAAIRAKHITWIAWGPRFFHEFPVGQLLRPPPRVPLLHVEDGAWWTIEPSAIAPHGLYRGLYLGKLCPPPSAAATRNATHMPVPVFWRNLPGVDLPTIPKPRPATRPAPLTQPRTPGSAV